MNLLHTYHNGNTTVSMYDDGTKVREYGGIPMPLFPESIDVKITNYCDLACAYCHEHSTTEGIHGDLVKGFKLLSSMPRGTEVAIGGGNPLSHPELVPFLTQLRDNGIIANITVNQLHLKRFAPLIQQLQRDNLIHGLGISYFKADNKYLDMFMSANTVLHMIIGVHSPDELVKVQSKYPDAKVLLLGYKTFGRGITYGAANNTQSLMRMWYERLHQFFLSHLTISFDNLGIEQLNVRRFFSDKAWQQFYMGDDGTFTMYVDMVKQEYARTSTSNERYAINDKHITDVFSHVVAMNK
jgi:hypothetical protein